jgi:CDP-diacylglycerol pyrophosphatase
VTRKKITEKYRLQNSLKCRILKAIVDEKENAGQWLYKTRNGQCQYLIIPFKSSNKYRKLVLASPISSTRTT